jgi:GxxExxY protein
MVTDEVVYRILKAARRVHATLGPGFVESIYTRALAAELVDRGFRVDRERTIKVWYGIRIVGKHRLDLLIDDSVIIELKANRAIIPVHVAQMNSYLQATSFPFGLIVNFGSTDLEWQFIQAPNQGL